MSKPLILISNDDGYDSRGIRYLVDFVSDLGEVLVCAPDGGRSGYSRSFSATLPLYLRRCEPIGEAQVWSCSGTPVDCVKMALSQIIPDRQPALVIGGINHGDNSTVNNHYSGTMGVAIEGCLKYIPSIAFSTCDYNPKAELEHLRPWVRKITAKVLAEGLPKLTCLNVNFPVADSFKGVRPCRMGLGSWINEVKKCHHPRGYDYYWMVGDYRDDEPSATDNDRQALREGYIALTPVTIDVTNYSFLKTMNDWESL